ncbi:biotin-dependent carboxyltransferase family protein [Flavobacteriaceae bacterium GSB9]|nr:biotin-dependent carboxyltransferase family protein [Flavobacteriaceae bacterium GSB9]
MVKVLKPGIYSSVQDLGRFGYQEFGVPYSGVMDNYAAKMVNLLLGNHENAAVIEMTMMGPTLEFKSDTLICISGAEMSPKLNKKAVSKNEVMEVYKGDVLSFGKLKLGFRSYLGVSGGFKTEAIMQSRSMYEGITSVSRLQKGEELPVEHKTISNLNKYAHLKVNQDYLKTDTVEVFKGPEFGMLSKKQQNLLMKTGFSISKENNRMAYQLVEPLENDLKPIITSAVMPGSVQLTPSGKLIVLMRDCQTTGGYPRVLQLTENAINVLSQKFTGQNIKFKIIE